MEDLQKKVLEMTGALNATLAQLKVLEARVRVMEGPTGLSSTETVTESPRLPRTELELREISQLPDRVKELQPFDGNPTQYVSWIHSVESILADYDIVRTKPIYRAILQSIRQKVRGSADTALVSYNIFDNSWSKIKECLSLHYADKRDIRTLEHQLNQLTQGNSRVDEFYASVNHQFSLIINKIKTENYSTETVEALVETYRNRSLDVFVRGLNGELSRLLIIQRPKTLPEAYSACLEMQNLNLRSTRLHPIGRNQITVPNNEMPGIGVRPQLPPKVFHNHSTNGARNNFRPRYTFSGASTLPPRPLGPKPAERMDVDRSVQSRNVNYMNRPSAFKRNARSEIVGNPFKQQKLFNTYIEASDPPNESTVNDCNYSECDDTYESPEVNFMTGASLPAFHT